MFAIAILGFDFAGGRGDWFLDVLFVCFGDSNQLMILPNTDISIPLNTIPILSVSSPPSTSAVTPRSTVAQIQAPLIRLIRSPDRPAPIGPSVYAVPHRAARATSGSETVAPQVGSKSVPVDRRDNVNGLDLCYVLRGGVFWCLCYGGRSGAYRSCVRG